MKKLIAILLLLAMCLGGCAEAQQSEQLEVPETTQLPESEIPNTTSEPGSESTEEPQASETTEETTPEETEPQETLIEAEGALTETKISHFLSGLPIDAATIDNDVAAEGGFWELGLSLEMIFDLYGELLREDFNYLDTERGRFLMTWQMARFDPNVQKTIFPGYTAIDLESFEEYYRLLFGKEPSLWILEEGLPEPLMFEEDGVRFYSGADGLQFAPPTPENMQFTGENGVYYIHGDLKVESAYPDVYPAPYCGKITIRLHEDNGAFRFHSIVLSDLAAEVKQENQTATNNQRLTDLIARVADGTETLQTLQAPLNYYIEPIYWMLGYWRYEPDYDASVIDTSCNYVAGFENRAKMAFFSAIDAESMWDVGFGYESDKIVEVTGGLAVTNEAMKESYKALFGEELNMQQLKTHEELKLGEYMVYGSYITGWGVAPCVQDLSYEVNENRVIVSGIYYDCADAPQSKLCRLYFTFEETHEGYRLVSLTASQL